MSVGVAMRSIEKCTENRQDKLTLDRPVNENVDFEKMDRLAVLEQGDDETDDDDESDSNDDGTGDQNFKRNW